MLVINNMAIGLTIAAPDPDCIYHQSSRYNGYRRPELLILIEESVRN